MQISARGLTFDVHCDGPDDGAAVLLLHGFPQHSAEWELVAPTLHQEGLRTIAVDQRGYSPGARPVHTGAYRMAECVADAVAILDALRVESAHVLGHDWGAAVGWQLAARHRARVRTLTAVSVPHPVALTAALATDPDQRERFSYTKLFRQAGKAERALLEGDGQRLRAMLTGVPPDRIDRYVQPMLDPGALTAALQWYRAASPMDLAGLEPVETPTTLVWSDQDLAIGRTAAESCDKYVTGDYRFVEVAGVTHWVPEEAPEAVSEAALDRMTE